MRERQLLVSPEGGPVVDSFFFYPWAYRTVIAVRTSAATCCWLVLIAGAGWLWPSAHADVRPAGILDLATTTGWVHRWIAGPGPRATPVLVALVVFLVVRHLGGRIVLPGRHMGFAIACAAAVLGTAAWALLSTGQPVRSALPSAIALVLAAWLRRRAGRPRRHSTTQAGYRPSWQARLGPLSALKLYHSRRADIGVLSWGRSDTDEVLDDAAQWFGAHNDAVSQAWCMARLVELQLDHNDVRGAELRVRRGLDDAQVKEQAAFLAACAKFYSAVGEYEQAERIWQDLVARSSRLPSLARIRAREAAAQSITPAGRLPTVTDLRRLALIWAGHTCAVVRDLANGVSLLAAEGGVDLLEEGYALCALPDELAVSLNDRDVSSIGGYYLMLSARGTALAAMGEVHRRLGNNVDAALSHMDAFEDFHQTHERRPATLSLLRSFTAAMDGGYRAPEQENHALDSIRAALQLMESDRLSLLQPRFRHAWIEARRALLGDVFKRLVNVDTQHAKAAELGVWLLESLHRTLVVNLMAADHLLTTDATLLAALEQLARHESESLLDPLAKRQPSAQPRSAREKAMQQVAEQLRELATKAPAIGPVDLEQIFRRLRGHYAVLFQCARDEHGWTVHGALITPHHGLHLHRARIGIRSGHSMASSLLNPVGALDALAGTDEELLGHLFASDLAVPVWRELSEAVLPTAWWDFLPSADEEDIELFIVPDGPLSRLPFAALPTPQGRPLGEHMVLNLIPALAFLQEDLVPRAHLPVNVAAVNLDDARLAGSQAEATAWARTRNRIEVRVTSTQDELAQALTQNPEPDALFISAHGEPGEFDAGVTLRDGTHLTAAAGLTVPWPPSVVLGSCWINHMDVVAGQEPFGLPLACLMRGATTVIGGSAPITSTLTGDLLAELADSLPEGNITSARLHRALASRTRGTDAEWLVPQDFALLTAWSTAPVCVRPSCYPSTTWAVDGTARTETTNTGTCRPDPSWSATLLNVLRHSSYATDGAPVGTLAFLAAVIAADRRDNDWTSFKVACEIGDPPRAGATTEAEQGIVTLLLPDTRIPLSILLYQLLGEGTNTARALGAETVTPAHVVLPILLDPDSEGAAWVRTHATGMDPLTALEERVLKVPLPAPQEVLGNPAVHSVAAHTRRMDELPDIDALALFRQASLPAWKPALAACLILAALTHLPLLGAEIGWLRDSHAGYMGVAMADSDSREAARVEKVQAGSPAQAAGLRAGDHILAVDGNVVPNASIAAAAIRSRRPASTVILTVQRGVERLRLPVRLATGRPRPVPH